jgi:hypothetical protein
VPEPLLNILKYLLIALIWLFFLRVLRAVWVEMRTPAGAGPGDGRAPAPPAPSPQQRPARPDGRSDLKLKIVSQGRRGPVIELGDELTVGRAPGCGLSLEGDTFASKVHARLFRQDSAVYVEDLGSTNGTYLNSDRVSSPTVLHRGDRLQVGQTVFEVVR